MREKVIILTYISSYDANKINDFLDEGWTVKSVSMSSEEEHTNAIFVLQIDENRYVELQKDKEEKELQKKKEEKEKKERKEKEKNEKKKLKAEMRKAR